MNVFLLGSGGREHALAFALSKSPHLHTLYAAPGNAGIAEHATLVSLDTSDHATVVSFCKEQEIGLVVIGPEAPLVAGLLDDLEQAGIRAFGPTKLAARLEGSKGFTKDICRDYAIPTAAYARFNTLQPALDYCETRALPVVVKADGLAAGKGVVICETRDEALDAVRNCFEGGFGAAGAEVVIEEYLTGEEVSVFALCDGNDAIAFGSAQDHKRVGDGDTGPNTGGMGAYSPANVLSDAMLETVMNTIIQPTLNAMADFGCPYKGVLFAGLMITDEGPKLIEYNCRFGDPECQVLMMRLQSDLLSHLNAVVDGHLTATEIQWSNEAALTIVMASKGYPGSYEKNTVIRGLETLSSNKTKVFHAGTKREGEQILATGGRVLNVTATGDNVAMAQARAYEAVSKIDWPEGFTRSDIGWREIARS